MPYDPILDAEIAVGKFFKNELAVKIKENFEYLNGIIGSVQSNQILNNSFEIDSDDDGVPDNWEFTPYTDGIIATQSTFTLHGAKTVKVTHPGGAGKGGGILISDYILISELRRFHLGWMMKVSTADPIDIEINVRSYDKDKIFISAQTVYKAPSGVNSTSSVLYYREWNNPANTRFVKIEFKLGTTTYENAGDIYLDLVTINDLNSFNFLTATTIVEETNADNDWALVASDIFLLPYNVSIPIMLDFFASMKSDDGQPVYMKFKVGSYESNEAVTSSTSYVEFPFWLFFLPDPNSNTRQITLEMWIKAPSTGGGGTITSKKDRPHTVIHFYQ